MLTQPKENMPAHNNKSIPDTGPGARKYDPFMLKYIYDAFVLRFTASYAWCCPVSTILQPLFNKHMTTSRATLDIGVGSGFYLEHAPFSPDTTVTLLDLNHNSLKRASDRLHEAHPAVQYKSVYADVMDPATCSAGKLGGPFDSISLMYLLHCLPGPAAGKAATLVRLRHLLTKEGTLFGCTNLGKGVELNWIARAVLALYNSSGVFENYEDDAESFVQPLKEAFEIVEWKVVGTTLIFEAKHPIL